MRGLEGAEDLVQTFLEARMPAKLVQLRARLGLAEGVLPDVAKWETGPIPRETLAIDDYPFVTVIGQEQTAAGELERGADQGDGTTADTYRMRYRLRVFLWARGDTFQLTGDRRNRLTLAATELLLENIALGVDYAAVDPLSLRASYSDVVPDDELRTIAAAYLELTLAMAEQVVYTGQGTTDDSEVDVSATPAGEPHPALV